jgi:hypothetical protein
MPIQVHGVLVHAMSGTELSRVRTEFRLRPPEPINKSSLESRGPTLLCNQLRYQISTCPVYAVDSMGRRNTCSKSTRRSLKA